ncbi:AAA family ATPase [Bradyrhizobium stylosanthis]|uniref:AAA family ATPase n=1 Tax=Bradyrhizobium stylosanthis TaxID=1803665 RepID=UPI0007C5A4A1|nr:AAA family ATPase [Bradyrhizobium stylosanthis]
MNSHIITDGHPSPEIPSFLAEAIQSWERTVNQTSAQNAQKVVANAALELRDLAEKLPDFRDFIKCTIADLSSAAGVDIRDVDVWLADLAGEAEQAPLPPRHGLDVVRMSDVAPVAIDYLWPGRLARGKVHAFAGNGGLGKSTVLFDFAARTTRGDDWPDGSPGAKPGDVIVLSSEDDVADTIAPRLIAAGADMTRVFVVRSVRDENARRGFSIQADLLRLETLAASLPNFTLGIFDPISSYLGHVDSHRNAEVRAVLDPLNDFAARTKAVVIANNHFSKAGGSANARILGSVAFVNAARAAFVVVPDEADETRRLLIPSKSNIAPIGTGLAYRIEGCQIEHDGNPINTSRVMYESAPVTISADTALAAVDGAGGGSKSSEAEDFLRDLLAGGPMSPEDIKAEASGAGISWATVRRAKTKIGVNSERVGGLASAGRWEWSLPSASPLRCSQND